MTIYSWNVLHTNRSLERAFSFIADALAQEGVVVVCLQEVPEALLARLKELPCHLAAAPETDIVARTARATTYLAVLSTLPITRECRMPLPDREGEGGWRRRTFANVMHLTNLFRKSLGNRHSLCADLALPSGQTLRIFNLHLPLLHPTVRAEEFEHAMMNRDRSRPAVVCGDFNILEKPHITPLNWLLGGTLADALLWRRERVRIEKRFAAYELGNALRGANTHPISRSQLDHILMSREFIIDDMEALRTRYGSDHRPIRVTARAAATKIGRR